MEVKTILQKILYFPLIRIVIGITLCMVLYGVTQYGLEQLFYLVSLPVEIENIIIGISPAMVALVGYWLLFKYYEKRTISELSTVGLGRNLLFGILVGVLLQSLTILVMYVGGSFSVLSINGVMFILPSLIMAFGAAIFEEILVRGIVFRIAEESLGSYLALIISAILFGAMHLANPNSSMAAAGSIAIQAGLLLACAYMYTRNLWFPIAIHFAWNFTQSGIFGANTSGYTMGKALLTPSFQGPDWLTGGAFGPEGSVQATLFCLAATIILMILIHRQHKIVKPSWVKR